MNTVSTLKAFYLTLVRVAGQLARLCRNIVHFGLYRRQRIERDAQEAERLDRIRNPHKYHMR